VLKNRLVALMHLTAYRRQFIGMAFAALLPAGALSLPSAVVAQSQSAGAEAPTVDAILDRYVDALGGKAALEKQTTRVSLGTVEMAEGHLHGTVLIHEKAPDKTLQVVIVAGTAYRQGFDGYVGWTDDPQNGPQAMSEAQLADVSRDSDFFHPLHLRQLYAKLTLTGKEKIGDQEAYVIEGATPRSEAPDKIYFSARTGLLIRVLGMRHTAEGLTALQEDFLDYRAVDKVQVPFTILQSGGPEDVVIKLDQVHFGVDLEDSEFEMPEFP
jgi:zinc protease